VDRTGLGWQDVTPAIGVLCALALVNVPYWFLGRRSGFDLRYFYLHWAVDLVAMTASIHFVGGIDAPIVQFAYLSIIPTAAIFVSRRAAFILAGGATVAYALLAVAESVGWLTPHSAIWGHHYRAEIRVFIVALSGVFFFVFAYLAGTLAELLRAANEELAQREGVDRRPEPDSRGPRPAADARARATHAASAGAEGRARGDGAHRDARSPERRGGEHGDRAKAPGDRRPAAVGPRRRGADRLVRDCRTMTTMLRNLLEVARQDRRRGGGRAGRRASGGSRRDHPRARHDREQGDRGGRRRPAGAPAEERKMQHVFENLVSNACKYVGDKTNPRIEITGATQNGGVEYAVRDNGVGMDATQLSRIFQLYHRAPDQSVGGVVQQATDRARRS
jgi:signal transduction histidine kinase